jgi:hypothetical protein
MKMPKAIPHVKCFLLLVVLSVLALPGSAQMFVGIGMTFQQDTLGGINYPKIQSFIPNGPAQKSGLQVGMCIISINGTNCRNLPNEAILRLIKGEEGESLLIMADKDKLSPTPRLFTLKRAIMTRESGDVLNDFYLACDSIVKSIENQGFKIIKTSQGLCADANLPFVAPQGKTINAKVFLLEIFNYAGSASCWLSASFQGSDSNSPITDFQRDAPFTYKGIEINSLSASPTSIPKQKLNLKLQSHPRESPTILREYYTVIYAK